MSSKIISPTGKKVLVNLTPARCMKARSNNYAVTLDTNGHESVTENGRECDTGITTPNGGLNAPLGDLVRGRLSRFRGIQSDH